MVLNAAAFIISPATFIIRLLFLVGFQQPLTAKVPLAPNVQWHQDYFAVEQIDRETIAIGEPRYWQKNVSYLLLGKNKALLFDSGPGVHNIGEVVQQYTDLPLLLASSHLHYDHLGNHGRVGGEVALIDLPELRRAVDAEGYFVFKDFQHLGRIERIAPPRLQVKHWLKSGETIDLGGRLLQVLSTPGHTPESIMLFDEERRQLFTGDFIYAGHVIPEHMGAYLETTNRLLPRLPNDVVLFGAHAAVAGPWHTPRLGREDLMDLHRTLEQIRDHQVKIILPGEVPVNSRITLLVPFYWNMEWNL